MRAIELELPRGIRSVLDFGCGTGWVIAEAGAERVPLKVGVDFSFDAVQQAKVYEDVHWIVADGLKLPCRDSSFDVVIGHVSMPYMNTDRALAEVHRVLMPGGSFFLTFHSFYYWRERLALSWRSRNWKDLIFMGYVAGNGLLNHFGYRQQQIPWRRERFETVNTPTGVARSGRRQGFEMICTEMVPERIFFVVTGRKPGGDKAVFGAPAWSVYSRLQRS